MRWAFVDKGDLEFALSALQQKFITSFQRKNISLLLKICCGDNPNVKEICELLSKSTFRCPHLPKAARDRAYALLKPFLDNYQELSIEDQLKQLTSASKDYSQAVWALLTTIDGNSVRIPFWSKCQDAGAFQHTVYPGLKKIVILGTMSETDFWIKLKSLVPQQFDLDILKAIIIFHGNLVPDTITLDLGP